MSNLNESYLEFLICLKIKLNNSLKSKLNLVKNIEIPFDQLVN